MTQNFTSELPAARARPDYEELRRIIALYYEWNKMSGKEKEQFLRENDGLDGWFKLSDDADRAISAVVIAASDYNDPGFLGTVGAGPLEALLREPSVETIERIVIEARKSPRLRWMLTYPYPHAMSAAARNAILPLIEGLSDTDPLPLASWA